MTLISLSSNSHPKGNVPSGHIEPHPLATHFPHGTCSEQEGEEDMDERVPWQTAPINKAVTVDAYSPLGHSQVSDVYILHKMSD